MNPDDLARFLDELGERLGPTGEYVFALTVRQVFAEAIFGLVMLLLFGILGVLVMRWAWPGDGKWFDRDGDPTKATLVVFAGGCLVFIALMLFVLVGKTIFTTLINPEYAALERLIALVNPLD